MIDEGRRIGAGDCVLGLNIHFYADAIQACATHGEWALAMELASELEALTRAEPMPLTDFAVRWARAGPAGRGAEPARETLTALHARALESQYRAVLPALEAALA